MCIECSTALICDDNEGLRECNCGKVKLLQEGNKKLYSGVNAIAICIPDEPLVKGVRKAEAEEKNADIVAYVCYKEDPRIYKVDEI